MEARPAWAALDAYLGDLAARDGPRHVATTTQQLRALRAACPTPSVAEVFAWRSAALRGGKSKATVNHYTGRLKTYLRWAAAAGMPVESALLALAPLVVTARDLARRPRAFTEAEAEAFIDACLYLDRRTTGVPIAHVSRLMGHSSTAFTERVYVDLTADDPVDAARRVLKRRKKEAVDEQPGLFDDLDE